MDVEGCVFSFHKETSTSSVFLDVQLSMTALGESPNLLFFTFSRRKPNFVMLVHV
jgi:hypothetical protein